MLDILRDSLDASVRSGSILAIVVAFLIGVFVGFTPCIYPILPITVAYIGRVAGEKKLSGLFYSLVYLLGMALVYCTVGVVTVLTGGHIGALWGNGWFLLTLGAFFMVLSLWMFKVIQIPAPQFIKGGSRRGGVLGALGMGAASGLVVGPCTVPGLAVMVTLISKSAEAGATGSLIFGVAAMFAYSVGLGSLVVVCGTFSGFLASLPKSGRWLSVVEKSFATLMLLGALFFVVSAGQSGDLPEMAAVLSRFGQASLPADLHHGGTDSRGTVPGSHVPGVAPVQNNVSPATKYTGAGSPSPAWAMKDLDGNTASLGDLRGKKGVMLVFFTTWCVACHEEVPYLITLQKRLEGRDMALLGVAVNQDARKIGKFKKRRHINYRLLLDEGGGVAKEFGIHGVPRIIGIDVAGIVRYDAAELPKDMAAFIKMLEQGGKTVE